MSLAGTRFLDRFGLQVKRIHRREEIFRSQLSEFRMEVADMLLAEGPAQHITLVENVGMFLVLGKLEGMRPNQRKVSVAVLFVPRIWPL